MCEKHRGDRVEGDSVALEVGHQLTGSGDSEHFAVWTESSVGENSLITRCKHERSKIVLEELATEVFGESIVELPPYIQRLIWKQLAWIELDAAIAETRDVDIAYLECVD